LGVVTVALVLCGPVQVRTEGQERSEPLAILIDASRSMRTQDSDARSRSDVADAWLLKHADGFARLADRYRLRFFLVGDGLQPWDGKGRLVANATSTDIGQALFALDDALAGERPAGALLISDGADRSALGRAFRAGGSEAVESLASDLGFPVSVWTVGSAEGPPDLGVELSVPPFGFVRRPLMLKATLSNRSINESEVEVLLREDGEIVATRTIALEEGEQVVSFEVKPSDVGFHTYKVELPALSGDTIIENNVAEATVKVIRDRTRVLQVSSRPSWDVKFLRRLLKTDPNIDLVSFFILRNSKRRGPLTRSGGLSLIAFPYEELFSEDLQGFDLVIFQDFWFGSFTQLPPHTFLANIADYVRGGGAFLMIGGSTSFGEGEFSGSAIDNVMPTHIPAQAFHWSEFEVELADAGLRHPVTRLDQEEERNRALWSGVSQLAGRNPLGALRDGAVALLNAGPGGPVLSAVRSVERGRTMAFASDESWRWSMSSSSHAAMGGSHASFWRNAIRWLVRDARQERVQVLLDQENYGLGDEVQVQVRVLGEDYAPQPGVAVTATIGALTGEPWQVVSAETDSGGQVTVTTQAAVEGVMVAAVDVLGSLGATSHAEARASVSERQGELENPRAEPELMTALARGTGGAVLEGESPDPGSMALSSERSLLTLDRRIEPLWDRWWWLLLSVLPLATEWTIRRRLGLR